ncbi:unnamed protein product [Adineta ricciae]|uniref:NAD(P)(+)--arginine ADP-ribosyltransferase n=1 Tax=Adineta ricciae TaxID=249248 RepID=A0A816C4G4_ADIRI|nr:unnamed protein product [Adineta ricciae]
MNEVAERFLHLDFESNEILTFLHEYKTYPLVPIKEAIEPIKALLYNSDSMIKLAKKNCRKPPDGLTQDESCAIYLYTMPRPSPHQSLFQLLHESFYSTKRDALTPWFLYLRLFFTALYKLPSYKGLVYHGSRKNQIDQYEKERSWWQISSCTEKMNLIDSLVENNDERTIFSIECSNGKSIRSHSHFPSENEILLLPGTSFQVVGKWKAGKDLFVIQLKEQISTVKILTPPPTIAKPLETKWKQFGVTILRENQLNSPQGIFIDKNKTIFIADCNNHRIVQHGKERRVIDKLNHPINVISDQEDQSLIITDLGNRRVIRWQNEDQREILIDNIVCYGLTMDKFGFIYVTDQEKNEVRRWKQGDQQGFVVAGGNGKGNQLNQLSCPTYIFVDEQQSIYVSDNSNHRVMKWGKGAKEGVVVAGGCGQGKKLNQLSYPAGVLVDHRGQIYVADSWNNRVMRWYEEKKEGEIIVGGNGEGNQSNQLNGPTGLAFDCEENLYVTDCINSRIQKYEILLK